MTRHERDIRDEIRWFEARRLERAAERARIEVALADGVVEYKHHSLDAVATVTPAVHDHNVMRITGIDADGPYWHTEVTCGGLDTQAGRRLVAERLHAHGFLHPAPRSTQEIFKV